MLECCFGNSQEQKCSYN